MVTSTASDPVAQALPNLSLVTNVNTASWPTTRPSRAAPSRVHLRRDLRLRISRTQCTFHLAVTVPPKPCISRLCLDTVQRSDRSVPTSSPCLAPFTPLLTVPLLYICEHLPCRTSKHSQVILDCWGSYIHGLCLNFSCTKFITESALLI
jgi:hypothetical protein